MKILLRFVSHLLSLRVPFLPLLLLALLEVFTLLAHALFSQVCQGLCCSVDLLKSQLCCCLSMCFRNVGCLACQFLRGKCHLENFREIVRLHFDENQGGSAGFGERASLINCCFASFTFLCFYLLN